MKPYPAYKSSGIDWLPKIPSHWEMSKAKYYFRYTTGFTPPTGQDELYNEGITWVTIADMNQKIVSDSVNTLAQLAIGRYKPDLTVKGSLLFSFKLSVGKVAFAGRDLYTNEAIISILPDEKYDVRYFYYTLPEQLLQNANENIYGAKMLNQELIRNASICFPPLKDQMVIANYLDKKTAQIDNLIANKQKLIELLKEERMSVIDEAMDGKGRNWEKKKLKYIAKLRDEIIDNADVKIAVENIESGTGKLVNMGGERDYDGQLSAFKRGDTIFNKLRPYLHKVYFAEHNGGLFGELLIIYSTGELLPGFLFYKLFSKSFIDIVDGSTQGTKMPRANWESFICQLLISFPDDKKEQAIIVNHIQTETERIDDLICKIEKEIELMQEYRTALISEVVTGKIKIN
ncbi:MAG TPA: restriction endonuclease subunit S [Bacteroidia bacterium]|jgi:type I restriction enzyme S subunit|nr:restriction endonuclease subunit S [Bacteroidia bacterium]